MMTIKPGYLARFINTSMNTPGEVLEGNIAQWITDQGMIGVRRPYIWPGAWPDSDLEHMAANLPRPEWRVFDSAWIYYDSWDPEIPGAVESFNRSQDRWHARVIHREGVMRPPRDIVAVIDRQLSDQVILSMWLGLAQK